MELDVGCNSATSAPCETLGAEVARNRGMPLSPDLAALLAVAGTASIAAVAWWRGGRPARIARLARGGAVLLDVGTREEFATGHAAGAVNIPAAELALRQAELGPHPQPILVYGRKGMAATLAAQQLRTIGFHTILCVGTLAQWERDRATA